MKFYTLAFLFSILFLSCSSPADNLVDLINVAAKSESTITKAEYEQLEAFVSADPENFSTFFVAGKLNSKNLFEHIKGITSKKRKSVKVYEPNLVTSITLSDSAQNSNTNNKVEKVHFYIENSGSMDPYLRGKTEFEAGFGKLYVLANNLYGKDKINVNFINNQVFSVQDKINEFGISDFINRLEPESKSFNQGNQKTSTLDKILKTVIDNNKKSEVSLFVSDCIYSVQKLGKDSQGALNFERAWAMDAFLQKFQSLKLSTLIIQMESSFNGKYFTMSDKPITLNDGVKRPYYIWVIGEPQNIELLAKNINFSELQGFKGKYYLSPNSNLSIENNFSVLKVKGKKGEFEPARGDNFVHELNEISLEKGEFQFTIAADFSNLNVDNSYLIDKINYTISDEFEVVAISKAEKAFFETRENGDWRLVEKNGFTHILTIKAKKNFASQTINISLKDQMPAWVAESNSDNDENIKSKDQINKTFGIYYLIGGVFDAYRQIGKEQKSEYLLSKFAIKLNK